MGNMWEKKYVAANKPDADEPDENRVYDGEKSHVVEAAPSPEEEVIKEQEGEDDEE